jgi:NDP-sugar pyrophosphorylase family protein
MSNRAVVLAGGMGTRLRPYTVVLPKPLMPVGEYPILEIITRQLRQHKFSKITMAVNHQAEIIKAFFHDGSKWGIDIDYSLESKPLSTIAPLRLIDDLPGHFLLMNGDVLTDLDFSRLFEEHVRQDRLFTVAASRRRHTIDYGVLHVDGACLSAFDEKPSVEYLVSMGVYVVSRRVLEIVPADTKFGFDDLMREMLRTNRPVHVEQHDGYWLDIGRPDDYMQAIDEFEVRKQQFLSNA